MEQERRSLQITWRIQRGTTPVTVSSMWYAAQSHRKSSLTWCSLPFVTFMVIPKVIPSETGGLLSAQKKKSTIQLVPDSDSLCPHLYRTNYLAYSLKHNQLQSHPSSICHRWHVCVPVRSTQPHFPVHSTTHKARGEKKVMTAAKMRTVTQTAVVRTVTMIVNQVVMVM